MIDRTEVINSLEREIKRIRKEPKRKMLGIFMTVDEAEDIVTLLKEQPERKVLVHSDGTIEPLQKHGHWIADIYDFYPPVIICSVCGCEFDAHVTKHKYCPECGAVMDEDVKKNGDTL